MSHEKKFVEAVIEYFDTAIEHDEKFIDYFSWSENRKKFSLDEANSFFISVMLDQGQPADRAWKGGKHFVENHFKDSKNFWENILKTPDEDIHEICTKGFDGKSYALAVQVNSFPLRLKKNASFMIDKYHGDPRKIWNVTPQEVCLIYDRFKDFSGIGDALAKMAQFILVRNHGVAGGKKNQHLMSVKPDIHVCRVLYRAGIIPTELPKDASCHLDKLNLDRPADFDAVLWTIGSGFCDRTAPNCIECPIRRACETGENAKN